MDMYKKDGEKVKKNLSNNMFETEVEHDCEFVKVEVLSVCSVKSFIKTIKQKSSLKATNINKQLFYEEICRIINEEAGEKLIE